MSGKLPGSTARSTNMKAVGPKVTGGGTKGVVLGSAIGSVSKLSKEMNVNRNAKAQPHGTWTKRAAQARAMAKPQKAAHTRPVNHAQYALKRMKPS